MKCYKLNFELIRKKGGNNIPATRCQLRDLVVSEYLQQQGICYIFLIFFFFEGGDSSLNYCKTVWSSVKCSPSLQEALENNWKPQVGINSRSIRILNLCCRSKQSNYDVIDLSRSQAKSLLMINNFGTKELGSFSFHRFKQIRSTCALPRELAR